MLVNMNEVLIPAKKNQYAVGLFNAVNLELARGIINAAEVTLSTITVHAPAKLNASLTSSSGTGSCGYI